MMQRSGRQIELKPERLRSLSRGDRRTWLVLASVALLGGAAASWSWLVAVGIAPVLLAVAPCAAMCALGMCMNPGSCSERDAAGSATPAPPQVKTSELGPV